MMRWRDRIADGSDIASRVMAVAQILHPAYTLPPGAPGGEAPAAAGVLSR